MRSLSKLQVSLKYLEENVHLLDEMVGKHKKILPMLKAEAYGHGAIPLAKKILDMNLHHKNLLEGLGFATVFEAYNIREHLEVCDTNLYIFSELLLQEKKEWYEQWGLIPVLSNMEDLKFFLTDKKFAALPLVLKMNSGMNRLGFDVSDQEEIITLLKKHNRRTIYHLMSHFACSYVHSHPSVNQQIGVMENVKDNFYKAQISVEHFSFSNSGAIEQKTQIDDETVVRPGIMLYGPSSVDKKFSHWRGKVISALQTSVLDIRKVKKGEGFGYGLHHAPEEGFLLILPLGYADGIQFNFNGFPLKIEDVQVKFLTRPSMDLCYLWTESDKVKHWKNKKISLWDHSNDNLQLLSDHNQTITYQILTAISSRVPRDYVLE